MTVCEVTTKDNTGSDHILVRMTLSMNKRLARLKTIKKQKPVNINTQKLKDMKARLKTTLKNRLEKN